MIQIGVSLLDSKDISKDLKKLNNADYLHIDIMDGKFVDNKSRFLDKKLLQNIKKSWKKYIAGHFMVVDPWNYIDYCKYLHSFTFHIETKNIRKTINLLKKQNMRIGISINPETSLSKLKPYLKNIDRVLVMTVHPGKGGQKLIKKSIDIVSELKQIKHKNNLKFTIAVDGGINVSNYYLAVNAGADSLSVGSGILRTKNYSNTISQLKEAIHIGADHGGFKLKQYLIKYLTNKKIAVHDHGSFIYNNSDDYPKFAQSVASVISSDPNRKGILICRSGVGVGIAANRFPYVFACLCYTEKQVKAAKNDDYANILCLGSDYITKNTAEKLVNTWLKTKFNPKERFIRRINEIDDVDIIY